MSLTFGFTSKKRPTVFYMNHKFNQHSKNNKGCIHWRCVEYARFKCRAKLVTFENKMLENSTPVHTHPTVKSSIEQKCTKSAREQQADAFDSFRTEDLEKQDEPKTAHWAPRSIPMTRMPKKTSCKHSTTRLTLQQIVKTWMRRRMKKYFGSAGIHQTSKKAKKVNLFSGSIQIVQQNLKHAQVNLFLANQMHRKPCCVLKTFSADSVKMAN